MSIVPCKNICEDYKDPPRGKGEEGRYQDGKVRFCVKCRKRFYIPWYPDIGYKCPCCKRGLRCKSKYNRDQPAAIRARQRSKELNAIKLPKERYKHRYGDSSKIKIDYVEEYVINR